MRVRMWSTVPSKPRMLFEGITGTRRDTVRSRIPQTPARSPNGRSDDRASVSSLRQQVMSFGEFFRHAEPHKIMWVTVVSRQPRSESWRLCHPRFIRVAACCIAVLLTRDQPMYMKLAAVIAEQR